MSALNIKEDPERDVQYGRKLISYSLANASLIKQVRGPLVSYVCTSYVYG